MQSRKIIRFSGTGDKPGDRLAAGNPFFFRQKVTSVYRRILIRVRQDPVYRSLPPALHRSAGGAPAAEVPGGNDGDAADGGQAEGCCPRCWVAAKG